MNIIFFGSPRFAVPSLGALLDSGYRISCVVTQPDRKKGRGLYLAGTAVKDLALKAGLKIYQPLNINTGESCVFLRSLHPDLFVVIAYGQILSQKVLNIPKIFSLNIHASLLPKYRGAAPINWVIINGEKSTGVTSIKMVKGMDAGPIILQRAIDIKGDDTSVSLEEKLAKVGAEVLLETLKKIKNNSYDLTPQNQIEATSAPKINKGDGLIDWDKSAEDLFNLVRGCFDWPGAFTYYKGKILKVYGARVIAISDNRGSRIPGEITDVSKDGILVATGKGILVIQELQLEGKRKMKVKEFIAGHRVKQGEILRKELHG